MNLSAVAIGSLALWIVLWAFGVGGFVAFVPTMLIILTAIALHVARS